MSEQRRLAAVVLADVVGFSRLMGEDERGTLDALRALRRDVVEPSVATHGGRLVKTMGDGFLVEFASAVHAVRCALAIERALAADAGSRPLALQLRTGINVGDVVVDGDDIYGDGVNVAARLQALAVPGTIVASKAVRDAMQGTGDATFVPLGAQRVKNIAQQVEVYRVEPPKADAGPAARALAARAGARPRGRKVALAALGIGAVLSIGAWFATRHGGATPEDAAAPLSVDVRAIAATESGDAASARIAEQLSREALRVLAQPGQTGRLDARPASAAPAARPARYRVEGEVARRPDGYEVVARAVEARNGTLLRSTRQVLRDDDLAYDHAPALQRPWRQLRSAIVTAEAQRIATLPLSALAARELVLRAWSVYDQDHSLHGVRAAKSLVDEALRRDPNLANAWSAKARLVNLEGDVDPAQDRDRIGREQDEFSARAVALDPGDWNAWEIRAVALVYLGRWEAALAAAQRSARLEPHDADGVLTYAWIHGLMGRPDEAVALADQVLHRDPGSETGVSRVRCEAHVLAGRARDAVPACEKSALLFNDAASLVYLVAAYAGAGETAKMNDARAQLLRTVPGYTIDQLRAKRYSDHPDYMALAERNWYPALRRAGIPER